MQVLRQTKSLHKHTDKSFYGPMGLPGEDRCRFTEPSGSGRRPSAVSTTSVVITALGEAIADYEAEFGGVTEEERDGQRRLDKIAAEQIRAEGERRRAQRGLGV